jgi:hypothetical protein
MDAGYSGLECEAHECAADGLIKRLFAGFRSVRRMVGRNISLTESALAESMMRRSVTDMLSDSHMTYLIHKL